MDKELFILNQEQLDAYFEWQTKKDFHAEYGITPTMKQWLIDNPCPLPPPVKVLKAIEISHDPSEQGMYESGYDACLSDLGLK